MNNISDGTNSEGVGTIFTIRQDFINGHYFFASRTNHNYNLLTLLSLFSTKS